jgi:DNA phosphorothioation-dependent restriction protein DptH
MTRLKITQSTLQDILLLKSKNKDVATIAREVDLNRMQVAAILAHETMRLGAEPPAEVTSLAAERSEGAAAETDYWVSESSRPRVVGRESTRVVEDEPKDEPVGGIYVGDDIDLENPATWEPVSSQNPHLMIMGESGSGKTYAAQCLVAELAQAGLPSIVFDYGQSFELGDLEEAFTKCCNPQEFPIGEQGLALNPLEIAPPDVKGPNQVATRLADVFDATFQLGDIQRKVLIDATLHVYRQSGIIPEDPKTWKNRPPNVRLLQDGIDAIAADKQNANARSAAGLSARLTNFFMLASFTDEMWSWDQLIDDPEQRVNILQFRGLEGKTRRVLVEMLLWHLFFHLKGHGQSPLRVFCVLDEAHHLSFRESGPLSALLREARKFGLGIIFASQQPEDFSPVAYSNSASKLIFQTSDPKLKVSKILAGKVDNFDRPEEIRDAIGTLKRGNALFITRNRGHLVHVADFPKRSTLWQHQ